MEKGEFFSPGIRRALPHERTTFHRIYSPSQKKKRKIESSSPPLRKKRKRARKTPGSCRKTVPESPSFPSRRLSVPFFDLDERKTESLSGVSCERSQSSKTSTPQLKRSPKQTPCSKTKYIQTNLHTLRRQSCDSVPRRRTLEFSALKSMRREDLKLVCLSPQRIVRKDDGSKRIIPEYLGKSITHPPRSQRIVPEYLGPCIKTTCKKMSRSTPTKRRNRVKPTFLGPLDDIYVAPSPDSSFHHPDGTNSNPGPLVSCNTPKSDLEYQKLLSVPLSPLFKLRD